MLSSYIDVRFRGLSTELPTRQRSKLCYCTQVYENRNTFLYAFLVKIALVHELLTMRGGAERVLRILADMYPEAPIYTLLYDEKRLGDWFPAERVRTSHLQKWAGISTNHHLYLRNMPAAVEAWDFSEFDLVLSTSSAFAHGIITNGEPKHVSYIHAPARYLWDRTFDVQQRAAKGLLGSLKKKYLERTFHKLREWDAEAADRANVLLSASKNVQRRAELYWRRTSKVVYPPVDDFWNSKTFGNTKQNQPDYFLIVSTLVPYKNIDIAIATCESLGMHLKIVGDGPDRKRLESLAGPQIEFYGHRNNHELGDLYADAKAVLFPGIEDFGLVPLEAMACGTPVIAYRKGGALETVIEGNTGMFFNKQTPESLAAALQTFDASAFDASACKARAAEFSCERFEREIKAVIENV